jgi:hypothetical protein
MPQVFVFCAVQRTGRERVSSQTSGKLNFLNGSVITEAAGDGNFSDIGGGSLQQISGSPETNQG